MADAGCETFKEANNDEFNSFSFTSVKPHQWAWILSGSFTLVATVMSCVLMWKHSQSYRNPDQQRNIIRILLMVPIYAICSFLSIRFITGSVFFDTIRSCYEAFVIYSFYSLLLSYLGPTHQAQREAMQKKPDGRYPFPFHMTFYNPRSSSFLRGCTRGVLQYALIHPCTSFIEALLEIVGVLCPENMSATHPMFWLTCIEMVSVFVAMYYLVLFYIIVKDDVVKYKPIRKFLAVKFVLFFSFWQSVVLSGMSNLELLPESDYFTSANVAAIIQNSLICFEMWLAAIMHKYCFGAEEYDGERTHFSRGLRDVILAADIVADTKDVIQFSSQRNKQRKDSAMELKTLGSKNTSKAEIQKHAMLGRHYEASDRLINNDDDNGGMEESDIGVQRRTSIASIDTFADMDVDEIDDEIDGVGIIRLNPRISQLEPYTPEPDEDRHQEETQGQRDNAKTTTGAQ